MKRVSVRLVPIETRSFKPDDFFIWLHHVTSFILACLVNVTRCILPESHFFKNSLIEAWFGCDQISKPNFSNLVSIYFT